MYVDFALWISFTENAFIYNDFLVDEVTKATQHYWLRALDSSSTFYFILYHILVLVTALTGNYNYGENTKIYYSDYKLNAHIILSLAYKFKCSSNALSKFAWYQNLQNGSQRYRFPPRIQIVCHGET